MIEQITKAQLKTLAAVESVTDRFRQVTGDVYPAASHKEASRVLDCSKPQEGATLSCTHLKCIVEAKKGSCRCKP